MRLKTGLKLGYMVKIQRLGFDMAQFMKAQTWLELNK